MSDAVRVAAAIERALKKHADPARQAFLDKGYAPSRLRGYGVSVPAMRSVVREFAVKLRDEPAPAILEIALALTQRRVLEARQVGYELAGRRRDVMALLTPKIVKQLGEGNDNWASVDGFAAYVSGRAWAIGRVRDRDVLAWVRSPNPWWRRTALSSAVALNRVDRGGDAARTLAICGHFTAEQDPMLAKALSWALRSAVRYDAAGIRGFLEAHRATLPKIVLREVTTKLDTGLKQRRPTARRM